MMVEHHHVQAELLGLSERYIAGGATVDRHQQLHAALGERPDGVDVRPVTFENPVGNMHDRIEPALTQVAAQQRRRRRAIDVVIAEDRDAFLADHRVGETGRRRLHVGEHMRIWHQPLDGGIEIRLRLVGLDTPARQHPRQQFRQSEPLRDGERAGHAAFV